MWLPGHSVRSKSNVAVLGWCRTAGYLVRCLYRVAKPQYVNFCRVYFALVLNNKIILRTLPLKVFVFLCRNLEEI